jgi:hypothetical protein
MTRRLTRALVALAVPALTVTALSTPAEAAAKGPKVPTVDQVATVYPHVAGGTAYPSSGKVYGPGRNCKPGKPIKGASATSASYQSADPMDYASTGEKPMLSVSAMRFRTTQDAIDYLHGTKNVGKCPVKDPVTGEEVKVKVKLKKIRFKLGDERQGWTITSTMSGLTSISHSLLVRDGKFIVSAFVMSTDGQEPPVKKAVDLTALTLKTATKK